MTPSPVLADPLGLKTQPNDIFTREPLLTLPLCRTDHTLLETCALLYIDVLRPDKMNMFIYDPY